MIDRYSTKRMKEIWNEQNKFQVFFEIEKANLVVLQKHKLIPSFNLKDLNSNFKVDVNRIKEIEQITKHDVIAFTQAVTEQFGTDIAKWFHYGLTSTDVVDTANAMLLKQANKYIADGLKKLNNVLLKQAIKYKNTPIIGRTHGKHGEITSFGLKWLNWHDEMSRNIRRFNAAKKEIEKGKISGAVGNHVVISPKVQNDICKELGIDSHLITTQVVSRDIYVEYVYSLASVMSTIEKIAVEVRHLQRTEINEVEEYFSKGQKGSSAMPHKRNPIVSENMTGISRIVRSYLAPVFENNILWHERDISHSSTERIILPDLTCLIDYVLERYTPVLENLVVYPDNMVKNIESTNGLVFSQNILLNLVKKGMKRADAYSLIQKYSFEALEKHKHLKTFLVKDKTILKVMSKTEIEKMFDYKAYFKHVDEIYANFK